MKLKIITNGYAKAQSCIQLLDKANKQLLSKAKDNQEWLCKKLKS